MLDPRKVKSLVAIGFQVLVLLEDNEVYVVDNFEPAIVMNGVATGFHTARCFDISEKINTIAFDKEFNFREQMTNVIADSPRLVLKFSTNLRWKLYV